MWSSTLGEMWIIFYIFLQRFRIFFLKYSQFWINFGDFFSTLSPVYMPIIFDQICIDCDKNSYEWDWKHLLKYLYDVLNRDVDILRCKNKDIIMRLKSRIIILFILITTSKSLCEIFLIVGWTIHLVHTHHVEKK